MMAHNHSSTLHVLAMATTLANGAEAADFMVDQPEDLPEVIADFDRVTALGRKGTSSFDRVTSLALSACEKALHQPGVPSREHPRADRFGVVAGTSHSSLKSVSDYSRATLEESRPYLVNPILFPNTIMNCGAGQAAIRFQLRGPNATIAGADLAGIQALHYAANLARQAYLDHVLVFGAEEITPEYTAAHRHWRASGTVPAEGAVAAVLSVEPAPSAPRLAATSIIMRMTARGESPGQAVLRCLTNVGVTAEQGVDLIIGATPLDRETRQTLGTVNDRYVDSTNRGGFIRSAQGLLALGMAVAAMSSDPEVRRVVLIGMGNEDQYGAAVVEVP